MENKPGILAKEKTLIKLFESSVSQYPDNPMFWEKIKSNYTSISYQEMAQRVYNFSCGLISLGIQKGDKVAIFDQARQDWMTAELGILYAGGVNVPLSIKLDDNELIFRLIHAGVKVLITSKYQYGKIRDKLQETPDLIKVILLDEPDELNEKEISFEKVLQLGKTWYQKNETYFLKLVSDIAAEDCAMISYTSGTTADPKGIMLSHKNLYTNTQQSLKLFTVDTDYKTLLILPLDHSFAHTAGMYVFLASGASLASVQLGRTPAATLKNVFTNINEIKPHALLSVPTLAKNLKKNIENGVLKKGRITQGIFKLGLKVAHKYIGKGNDKGKAYRMLFRPLYGVFDLLIFQKIRQSLGGNLKYFVGGGALLDLELQKFFFAIGIPMYQGYGLTEASPVISANNVIHHKMGSSGQIVPHLEVKICDESGTVMEPGQTGEIIVKGDNVMMGYFKNEEATNETIKNGWLSTGDLGFIDNEKFLHVLGRYKSLLIGDDGEKFSPEGIEEYLEEHSALIRQIMIYNNQKPYTTALIFPEVESLTKLIRKHKYSIHSEEGQNFVIEELIKQVKNLNDHIENGSFPQRWLPTSFILLPEGFTSENQMLNSTLKMVRGKIVEEYEDQIQYLYTPEGKTALNHTNREVIQKLLRQ